MITVRRPILDGMQDAAGTKIFAPRTDRNLKLPFSRSNIVLISEPSDSSVFMAIIAELPSTSAVDRCDEGSGTQRRQRSGLPISRS